MTVCIKSPPKEGDPDLPPPPPPSYGGYKVLQRFKKVVKKAIAKSEPHLSLQDKRRKFQQLDYFCLFLFGLLNPTLKTMRGLCEASRFEKIQNEVCSRKVAPATFSEIQHVVDPVVLKYAMQELAREIPRGSKDKDLKQWQWIIQDSSVFSMLSRARWALYGGGYAKQVNNAIRLHLSLDLETNLPVHAVVTKGNVCERQVWREVRLPNEACVADRNYSQDYQDIGKAIEESCAFVLRVKDAACFNIIKELPITEEDKKHGVIRQAEVTLGATNRSKSVPVRMVWIQGPDEIITLITNLSVEEFSAEAIGRIYKQRWQVELFFRWIKCILKCRHFLAEGPNGAVIQIYLALIATLLLQLHTQQKPTKRMLEVAQLYMDGWVSDEELLEVLKKQKNKA
jgi:hypothetical protein